MRSKMLITVVAPVLCGLVALSIISSQSSGFTSKQDNPRLHVNTPQLKSEDGVTPVEVRCDSAELSASNALKELSCIIKNNTEKHISAATIATSISLEKDGEVSADTSFLTIETFVHPDVREEGRSKLIPPRRERPIRNLPTSYDNEVIRGITVRIDYVEFTDNTALGPNRAGSRIVTDIREGAAKYKNWLIQKYNRSGKSMSALIPHLESQPTSEELDLQNGDEIQGAIIYRRYVNEAYKSKGREGLAKYLR